MQTMVIVKNNMARPVGYSVPVGSGATPVTKTKRLIPGPNEVPLDEFERATKKSREWAMWRSLNNIELVHAKGSDGAGTALATLAPELAKSLVSETFDVDLLKKWIDHETRPAIRESLRKRAQYLEREYKSRVKADNLGVE